MEPDCEKLEKKVSRKRGRGKPSRKRRRDPPVQTLQKFKSNNVDAMRVALGISASVVSLVSYLGKKRIFSRSGTIVECEHSGSSFHATILTSATLLQSPKSVNVSASELKVIAYLSDGKRYVGEVSACDFHHNIAAIKIQSHTSLPTANLRCMDDSISVHPSEKCSMTQSSSQPVSHSNLFYFLPGEPAILIGRYRVKPHQLMAASGVLSIDSCRHDCNELFIVKCRINKCGIGGPVVNKHGDVIGMAFYGNPCTPFLPANVVCKWWDHFKKFQLYHRPHHGIQITNLYAAKVHVLEEIFLKFPNISQGILVKGVSPNSPADRAGICPNDVIVKCHGNNVQSLLQFFEMMWDKVGVPVELVVMRPSDGKCMHLCITADEAEPDKFNCWLLPRKKKRLRFQYIFNRSSKSLPVP